MFAAKDEKNAVNATLLYNIAHYALRPWPWIIVALASLVVFPDLASLQKAFPNVPVHKLGHDLAYPAMISFLPHGLLGLVVASLMAAYMSTISTHLNWGSSYVVNDFYKRFVKKEASEKELVLVGRLSTLCLMVISGIFALLLLKNAFQAFKILLQIGAGTGLLFILRWFWWRINAFSEITAMIVSALAAAFFEFTYAGLGFSGPEEWKKFVLGVAITTAAWISVTLLTKSTDKKTLFNFYRLINPGGPGWKRFLKTVEKDGTNIADIKAKVNWDVPGGLLCVFFGCLIVYGALFSIGFWIYSNYTAAVIATLTSLLSTAGLVKSWNRLRIQRS
jgi:Na+/proline symporter